jgi:leader peptidase (prepilin peptidase)/N-methyltransferase
MSDAILADSAFLWIIVVFLGLCFGSFANVLIWRLPRNQSIVKPRSRCPGCGNLLKWYHNIPVFSWLVLRGKCGFCRTKISWVYPVVELITAALFAAFYARYGVSWTTLGFWYMSLTLVAVFFIDLEHQIIPNKLTYPGVFVGFATSVVSSHLPWHQSLLGIAVGAGIFVGVAVLGRFLFKKESMGGGDVKLAAMLGAFLGVGRILLVFVLSAAIGLVISLVAMAVSEKIRRERIIPFGPFIALATLVVAFYGEAIVSFYVRHFLP